MGLLLNIETATTVCSVGLAKDGNTIGCKETSEEKSHASLITIFIKQLLEENKIHLHHLNAVVVSKGPGSYTGLRIGVSVAKGICYGANIPLISIDTLQALSFGIPDHTEIINTSIPSSGFWLCPMLDARRMEVYTAFYDTNYTIKRSVVADIITPESYKDILHDRKIVFFGSGSIKCKPVITHPNAIFLDNVAASALKMAMFSHEAFVNKKFEDVAYFQPFYLKEFQTTTPKNKIFK